MNTRISAAILTVLAGAAVLAPTASHAGNIGYVTGQTCSGPGDKTAAITAAGHTPVAIGAITPASLSGLSALIVESCGSYANNADINAAVNGGMGLLLSDWSPAAGTGTQLPGTPAVSYVYNGCIETSNFPAGSPAAEGPGGTLTDTSLDGGNCSAHGYMSGALPAGVQALTTTDDSPSQSISLLYQHGAGTVVYAPLPWSWFLPGGTGQDNAAAPGIRAFMINSLALVAGEGVLTTCASEGYTGTKLLWCQKICESNLEGAALDSWIHRWINRYRDLPYCAMEEAPQPE
ncbi:hypothetical protein [Thermomonas sp.]|uniref:hypothetical protein n=1 Tax=Thermomonas sp. TaxID=1971895 RepID=UPI0035B3CAEE